MGGFIAAFLISVGIWCIRFKYDRPPVNNDFKWVFFWLLWLCRQDVYSRIVRGSTSFWIVTVIIFFSIAIYYLVSSLLRKGVFISQHEYEGKRTMKEAGSFDFSHLKPLVFPCRTSHTRMFPKIHSFSYSYLFVGIPIGWKSSRGHSISTNVESLPAEADAINAYQQKQKSWFTVEAADYLNRGNHARGLKGKLEDFIKSQDEDPEDYPHTYLVTAPGFLGYSFNPVSFWYLYNKEKELKAMILEVNNTFDERRMYLLKDTEKEQVNSISESSNGDDENGSYDASNKFASIKTLHANQRSAKFATRWAKDFHVSPFNSRKGSYALSAHDPFFPGLSGKGAINNTITLRSSKDHVKLIAKVFSTQGSIDPSSLSRWERLRLVASWWWVGFMTNPRIVREAVKLFFQKKLYVWYRPEVLKDSIGRHETADERTIELCFRDYLRHQMQTSPPFTLPLKYTSTISTAINPEETIFPQQITSNNPVPTEDPLVLKITTPLFYAQIVSTPDPASFLSFPLPAQTYHTSHPTLLPTLFLPTPSPRRPSFFLLSLLRRATKTFPTTTTTTTKTNSSTDHPLDTHAQTNLPVPLARKYRRAATKLLLADALFGGTPLLVDILVAVARVTMCYWCAEAGLRAWRAQVLAGMSGGWVSGAGTGPGQGWTLGLGSLHWFWFAGLWL